MAVHLIEVVEGIEGTIDQGISKPAHRVDLAAQVGAVSVTLRLLLRCVDGLLLLALLPQLLRRLRFARRLVARCLLGFGDGAGAACSALTGLVPEGHSVFE